MAIPATDQLEYESKHVHQVYEEIATHFSATRYKPWPVVDEFLRGLPTGAVGLDVGCGNGKYLPVNRNVFIVASDRIEALRAILQTLEPASESVDGGQALIFVWALEQKNSRRGWDTGHDQDVLVPWVLKPEHNTKPESATTYHRYYHLYHEGELEEDAKTAGARIVRSGFDRDNWWIIIARQR
ncbi:tRNA methyltransferase, has a role in tRNA modification [Exophiala xenobiotica]|nr:tRNA methyltransferase, has a role in tRNA modification [Exophiala xenobiotica]